jgi:citrate lyase beta subunit
MAISRTNPLATVRSVMETPVLDERKWAKVPDMATDAVLVDMEDTVAQSRKLEGRAAVVRALGNLEYFGSRVIITRPNSLDTEWGKDDTVALAQAGAQHVILPMVTSAADVLEYQRIFHDYNVDPVLIPGIETPGGAGRVEDIAAIERVGALVFGEGDLTASMGIPLFREDGSLNPTVPAARARVYMAAAAGKLPMLDVAFTLDIKDDAAVSLRVAELRDMGATGLFALYPPHIAIINSAFTPDPEAVAHARKIVTAFEEAGAAGKPAVQLASGLAVLIHDYKKAVGILSRAG